MTYSVLSLDGGGVRGIMETVILDKLDELTERPLVELFNLQIASSTGSLILGGANCPLTRYKFSEITELYKKNAKKIFRKPFLGPILNPEGFFKAQYCDTGLNKILKNNFKNSTLREIEGTKLFFTNYVPGTRNTGTVSNVENPDKTLRDAIRECSAAPTYFTPYNGIIDGGVGANNPAGLGYAYAVQSGAPPLNTFIVSVGTGKVRSPFHVDDGGIADIGARFPRLFLDGQMSATDLQMHTILKEDYVRIQFDISEEDAVMDKVDPEHLEHLEKIAECYTDDHIKELKEVAQRLDK